MRYELARRLRILVTALAALGQRDNSRALERRIEDASAVAWLHTPHGEHVWAEIAGGLEVARAIGPAYLAKLVRTADNAFGEAEALLAEETTPVVRLVSAAPPVSAIPRPAQMPTANLLSITERLDTQARELERPTLRLIPGGASPSQPPKRAA